MGNNENKDENLLHLAKQIKKIRQDELSKLPLHINIISISAQGKLKETAHSAILQQILFHPFILDSFLKNIAEIDNPNFSTNQVRPAEAERMDVSIYGKDQCVIIENKVNGAGEQPGQIFRYVQHAQENKEHSYKVENIKVIYLNPSNYNKPSKFSLTEEGNGKNWVDAKVIENMIIKNYSHDIYEWIKELQNEKILESESYLRSALHQYQDYLEEFFELTDKFEPMKNKFKDLINQLVLKNLSEETDVDFTKRISLISETKEGLDELKNVIDNYYHELLLKQFAYKIQNELNHFDLSVKDLRDFGYKQENYGIEVSLNNKVGFLMYGYGDKYIGFAFNSCELTQNEKNFLNNLFKKFGMKNFGEEPLYPCWNFIGEQNEETLQKKYSSFVQFVIEQSKLPQEGGMKLEIIR